MAVNPVIHNAIRVSNKLFADAKTIINEKEIAAVMIHKALLLVTDSPKMALRKAVMKSMIFSQRSEMFAKTRVPNEGTGAVIWFLFIRVMFVAYRQKNGCHFPCRQTITDFRPRAKIVMGKAAAVVHNKL